MFFTNNYLPYILLIIALLYISAKAYLRYVNTDLAVLVIEVTFKLDKDNVKYDKELAREVSEKLSMHKRGKYEFSGEAYEAIADLFTLRRIGVGIENECHYTAEYKMNKSLRTLNELLIDKG